MREVLIVNLKRFGDIFSTGHLINSMVKENPHQQISLLVYKEFVMAAKLLKNVNKIFTIDRGEMHTILGSPIFSDAFAINKLKESLDTCAQTKWNVIVNISNDKISSLVSSYLSDAQTEIKGLRYDSDRMYRTSSDWNIVYNDVLSTYPHTPVHYVDNFHFLTQTNRHSKGEKVIINSKHNETAFKYISQIRAEKGSQAKVIGLQSLTSEDSKNITAENFEEFARELLDSPDYVPLLIVAPLEKERLFATELNKKLSGRLTIVESDFLALPSVLLNIDLLVTPDTAIKHLADLLETPVIEVSLGPSPFLKQGSVNPESIILSGRLSTRVFKYSAYKNNPELLKQNDLISSYDLLLAIDGFFNNNIEEVAFSNNVSVYRPSFDALGTYYKHVNGAVDSRLEFAREISRAFVASYFEIDQEESLYLKYFNDPQSIIDWCEDEKNSITAVTKELLSTLRSLSSVKDTSRGMKDFLKSLGHLLEFAEQTNVASIPLLIFRSKIDEMPPTKNYEENLKLIEKHIYELKNNVQTVLRVISQIEGKTKKVAFERKFVSASL